MRPNISPETLLTLRPSGENQARVAELIAVEHEGTISPDQVSALDEFMQLEHLRIMAKARARVRIQLQDV